MKKFIVLWKPRREGRTTFRSEVMAPDIQTAPALVGIPLQGEVVAVTEYVKNLWAPLVASGAAEALMNELQRADSAHLDRMHAEGRPVRD